MNPDDESIAFLRRVIPTLPGWSNPCPDRAIQLYRIIRQTKPQTLAEIGVFGGRSLIPQALAVRDNGSGHVIGIDPWSNVSATEGGQDPLDVKWWAEQDLNLVHKIFMDAVWKYGLEKWITVVRGASQDVAWIVPQLDMLALDGNHNPVASCRDVDIYLPKLKQNGFLVMDDTDWPQTQSAIKLIDRQCKLHSDFSTYRFYCKGDPESFQTC